MTLTKSFQWSWWRFIRTLVMGALVALMIGDLAVTYSTRGRIFRSPEAVPDGCVGLVLGTSRKMSDGRMNYFYQARLDAAGLLYLSGRVPRLILSGTSAPHYNEPDVMRQDLKLMRVREKDMILDGKGFRTLDSVLRAKRVYQADRIVIVSQKFHVERAVFLARAFGIDAYGYAADDTEPFSWYVKVRLREITARARAILDVTLLKWTMGSVSNE